MTYPLVVKMAAPIVMEPDKTSVLPLYYDKKKHEENGQLEVEHHLHGHHPYSNSQPHHHHHHHHNHHHVHLDMPHSPTTSRRVEEHPLLRHGTARAIPTCIWQILLASGILIYGSHAILLNLCKVDGKIPFNSSAVVLLIEFHKLLFSVVMFAPEVVSQGLRLPHWRHCVLFAVPALLYCINNNIVVHMQLYMDPASFQVLSNLKIASTAILYRYIIRRRLTRLQWMSMWMLMFAGICNSYGGLQFSQSPHPASEIYITLYGLILMILYCTISGLAGVYTEYILKKNYQLSLHLQNILLYIFGLFMNYFTYISTTWNASSESGFFQGFTALTFIIVMTQAANGLIMSAVMKHTSNIIRLFIITCAMLVTTTLSMLLFNLQLNVYYWIAFVLVFLALLLYHKRTNIYTVKHF
ncbi:probable UDP-sugar transporter protein SLC35A4 [Ptychodera flava]|uniref:probable UDP-sugar transporter protein SLC35A4 n=1 Tax=Ptychodera flava TaxID=63121 RepID=UPI00396A6EC7